MARSRLDRTAVFAALGDPTRLGILDAVAARGEVSATELARSIPVTRQAIAKHLGVLDRGGLVRGRRSGRETLYSVVPETARETAGWLVERAAAWDDRLGVIKALAEGGDGGRSGPGSL